MRVDNALLKHLIDKRTKINTNTTFLDLQICSKFVKQMFSIPNGITRHGCTICISALVER